MASVPSAGDGQTNRPCSRRFAYSDMPIPSCQMILISPPLAPLKRRDRQHVSATSVGKWIFVIRFPAASSRATSRLSRWLACWIPPVDTWIDIWGMARSPFDLAQTFRLAPDWAFTGQRPLEPLARVSGYCGPDLPWCSTWYLVASVAYGHARWALDALHAHSPSRRSVEKLRDDETRLAHDGLPPHRDAPCP